VERTHGYRESALSTPRRVRAVVVGRARDHVLVRPDLHFPPFFERAMAHRGMDDLSCRLVFRIKRLLRDDAEREQCVRHVKHFLLAQALQQRKVDLTRSLARSLTLIERCSCCWNSSNRVLTSCVHRSGHQNHVHERADTQRAAELSAQGIVDRSARCLGRSLTHLAESFSQATNYVAIAKHLGDMLVMHYFAVRNLVPDLFLVRRVARARAPSTDRPIDRWS